MSRWCKRTGLERGVSAQPWTVSLKSVTFPGNYKTKGRQGHFSALYLQPGAVPRPLWPRTTPLWPRATHKHGPLETWQVGTEVSSVDKMVT